MKNCYVAIMLILGTIIGAGFCSGKEICVYFAKFGVSSLFFIPILFLLYYLIFKLFLTMGSKKKYENMSVLNYDLFGKKHSIYDFILMIVFLIFSSAMLAGLGELGDAFLIKGSKIYVISISAIISFFVLIGGFNCIKIINALLVPIILGTIVLCCFVELSVSPITLPSFYVPKSFLIFFTPIIYACQGLSVSYYILIKTGNGFTKKQINIVSLIGSLIFIIIVALAIIVFQFNPIFISQPMPFVSMAISLGYPFDILYFFVIVFAIYTTLFSTTKSFHDVIYKFTNRKKISAFVTCISALILSLFGFDKIIEYLYPLIGCLGFIILLSIIISDSKSKKRLMLPKS